MGFLKVERATAQVTPKTMLKKAATATNTPMSLPQGLCPFSQPKRPLLHCLDLSTSSCRTPVGMFDSPNMKHVGNKLKGLSITPPPAHPPPPTKTCPPGHRPVPNAGSVQQNDHTAFQYLYIHVKTRAKLYPHAVLALPSLRAPCRFPMHELTSRSTACHGVTP